MKGGQRFQPQTRYREWTTSAHVEDEELKRAYRGIVADGVVQDEELQALIASIKQPLTKDGLYSTMQRSQKLGSVDRRHVLEPMLFQTDYAFEDREKLRVFQEI